MGSPMRLIQQHWGLCLAVSVGALLMGLRVYPQVQSDAEKTLIEKAQALETRGRPDIAAQVWEQVLLSDPNNLLALEGAARSYRLSGNGKASDAALDKLRRVNPSDPNLSKIQAMTSNKTRDVRLGEAGALAKAGNAEGAMKIYRDYFGDRPPDGDMGLAYYDTLYGTANGKQEAVAGLRGMAARNPGDPRFIVALGRMLTYEAKTRAEGIKILREHEKEGDAAVALRQALVWDSANPASAAELREYMKQHPKDTELAGRLQQDESKLAEMNSGIARTPAEKAAFAALNSHRLDEAQARFQALLEADPKSGRAAAGMGFLRMQQGNFGGAVSYLTQAEQNGYRAASVSQALATSRFWFTMGEASTVFDANQLDVAEEKYKAALEMRPKSPEALNGLAGLYVKTEQFTAAAEIYQQLLKEKPGSADAWRGLFLAYARAHQDAQAMNALSHFPNAIKAGLSHDPDFLQTLASIYQAQGRDADAQKVLAQALALPYPDNGANLRAGTRLQYAGILMEAKRYDQAAAIYKQILDEDTTNLPAWMGLVAADHQLGLDHDAIALVEKMPPSVYEAALSDAGFLSMLGSMYQQSNQLEIAQGLLERTAKLQTAGGGQPSVSVQIQLASIYLQRNNTEQAYGLYRQILTAHPDNLDAWRGLIGTLQSTNRNVQALQEIQLIPPAVRKELESDVQFEQGEANLYAATGDQVNAILWFNRVSAHYRALKQQPPADVEIQGAYLLYNNKDDRALYPALMQIGARQDLTLAERATVQGLWANWAVRRSGVAFANGNNARALEILDAAAQAFPDNMGVRKAVAGGYLTAGHPKESLSIFKSVDFQDASAADFQGAIGAALAASDKAQAEVWLRQALQRYPRDPAVLGLAARFEQARGDNARAADYWRASIGVMPQVSPADKLAHELVNPEPTKGVQRAATPRDLAGLLNPDDEPFPKTNKLPPLPSYGHDPYDGSAPVLLAPAVNAMPATMPVYPVPTTTTTQLPAADILSAAPSESAPIPKATVRRAAHKVKPQTQASNGIAAKPSAATSANPNKPKASGPVNYTGRMHLPAADDSVSPSDIVPAQPMRQSPTTAAPPPSRASPPPATMQGVPQASLGNADVAPGRGLRLTSQPMSASASRAQALLAEQTDGQLTQGFSIRYLPNARPSSGAPNPSTRAQPGASDTDLRLSAAQYTPSAQDAAAGAYSAQKPATQPAEQQPAPPPLQQAPPPQPAAPSLTPSPKHKRRKSQASTAAAPATTTTVPTLVTASGGTLPQQPVQQVTDAPTSGTQSTSPSGLTDEELQERNLPPLRGPWVRVQREPKVLSPRDEAEMQLRTIEGGYSAWLGGTGIINHRSGDPGYEQLTALEAPFEASLPLGTQARLTFIAKPVFLDSGQANGNAQIQTISNSGVITVIPEPIGTLTDSTIITANPPAQQNAAGIGGEAQLTWANLSIAGGYTPFGFLISTFTARASWRPGNGPFSFAFNRDSVKDTQLSYGGLRDPATVTQSFPGNIWGGVMANSGNVQFARGDLASGYYVGVGGQYLTGYKVQDNTRIDGSMGAYWKVYTMPEYGALNVGANFFAMHYGNNLQAFTYGMGGYFSPQAYFLANVPVTWSGHYQTRWHYTILGSLGIQAFESDKAPLFPLSPTDTNQLYLAPLTSVGPNYDLRGQVAYGLSEHWFVGGFASANNSRNYAAVSAGFSVRYLFRPQPSTVAGPTGLFLTDDQHPLRPLMVP